MNILTKIWHLWLKQPFKLSYEMVGRGDQDVVLLHGIAGDRSFWQPLVDSLDHSKYRILIPDLLGHGRSPRPDYASYSTDDQANAVHALLKQLKIKDSIILGHSMGALVATRLVSQYQHLFKNLLLYEPPLFTQLPEFSSSRRRKAFYFNMYDRIAGNPTGNYTMTKIVAKMAKNWQSYLASEQTWLPIERSFRNNIMQATSWEELNGIALKTDIVHGRFDVAVPTGGLKRQLKDKNNIKFHKTNDLHRLSGKSVKYLVSLIDSSK